MRYNANAFRDFILGLCVSHGFDWQAGNGSDLKLVASPSLMPLMITAYSPKTVAVWQYHRANGDTIMDPDVHFYVQQPVAEPDPLKWDWFPMSFEQSGVMYQSLFTLDKNWNPTPMDSSDYISQYRLADFCNGLWLSTLKAASYTLPTV